MKQIEKRITALEAKAQRLYPTEEELLRRDAELNRQPGERAEKWILRIMKETGMTLEDLVAGSWEPEQQTEKDITMLFDTLLQFSSAQDVTAAAGSTNVLDLSGALRNVGVGESLMVVIKVTTALTDSGSDSSLAVTLEGDSTESFSPDATMPLLTIPALAAAGNEYYARIDPDFAGIYRYVRLKYTPVGGDLTTGAVSAFVTLNVAQKYTSYANGYTIS